MYVRPSQLLIRQRSPYPSPIPQAFPVGGAAAVGADGYDPNVGQPIQVGADGGTAAIDDPAPINVGEPLPLAASDGGYDDPTTHTIQEQPQSQTPTPTPTPASAAISPTKQAIASSPASSPSDISDSEASTPSTFKIVYLTPLFVLIGIFLTFSVGGKIWGKCWHRKEKQIRRAERRARRAANKERSADLEKIRQGWIENGNGERRYSANQWLKDEVDSYAGNIDGSAGNYNGNGVNGGDSSGRYQGVFGNDSDSSDSWSSDEDQERRKAKGNTGLASRLGLGSGHSKSRGRRRDDNQYATTRTRNGKWENEVQSNNWISRVKMGINNFSGDEQDRRGDYTSPTEDGRVDANVGGLQRKPTLRASLRGTWNRVKKAIAWNVGWGYNGPSPGVHTRRRLMRNAPPNGSPAGFGGDPLPHIPSGLFFPPTLLSTRHSGAYQAQVSAPRHSEDGDDSIPLLEDAAAESAPKFNTFANLNEHRTTSLKDMLSTSGNIINAAWHAVTASSSARSHAMGGEGDRRSSGGRHKRLRTSDSEYDLPIHQHPPGETCELSGPQHLPPASVISLSRRNSEVDLEGVEQVIEIPLRRGNSKRSSNHSKQPSTSGSSGAIIFGSPTKMSPTKVFASSRPGTSYWPEAFDREDDEPISPTSQRPPIRPRNPDAQALQSPNSAEEGVRPWRASYISSTPRGAISPPHSPPPSASRLPNSPARLSRAATHTSAGSSNRIRGDPNGSPVKRGKHSRRMTGYDSDGERLIFAGSSASASMMDFTSGKPAFRSITRSKTMGAESPSPSKQSSTLKRSTSRATTSSINSHDPDEIPRSSTPQTPTRPARKGSAASNSQSSINSSPCRLPRAPPPSCADLLSFAEDEDEYLEESLVDKVTSQDDSAPASAAMSRTKSSSKSLDGSESRAALARPDLNRAATASEIEPSDPEDAPSLSSGASSSGDSERSVKTVADGGEVEVSVSHVAGMSFGDESQPETQGDPDRSFSEIQNDLSLGQISILSNNDKSSDKLKKSLRSRKDLPAGNAEGEDEFMCAVARLGEGTNAIDEVLAQLGSGTEDVGFKMKKSSASIKTPASARKKASSNSLKKSRDTQDENSFSTPTKSLPKHVIGDDSTCSTPRSVRNQSPSLSTSNAYSPSISSPSNGTPLNRKKTWQQKNGRWFRLAEDGSVICRGVDGSEMLERETWSPSQELESPRPEKDFVSPMTGHSGPGFGMRASLRGKDNKITSGTPPSLPPPPDSQVHNPASLSASPLPRSLQVSSPNALTPGKLQGFSSLSSSSLNGLTSPSVPGMKSEDIFASPPSVYSFATTAFSPPVGSPLHTASLTSSTKSSKFSRSGTSDLAQGATFPSFGAAAISAKKTSDLKRGSVDSGSSSDDGGYEGIRPLGGNAEGSARSPKRRAAVTNRPPKRYQAALSGSSISSGPSQTHSDAPKSDADASKPSSLDANARSATSTPRGVKSPAQKERERQEALAKVNTVINDGWKQQQ